MIVNAPPLIVSVKEVFRTCAVGVVESIRRMVTRGLPAAVGVPLITPVVAFSDSPGSEPEEISQVYGLTPPTPCSAKEYGTPTCAFGSAEVTMENDRSKIAML